MQECIVGSAAAMAIALLYSDAGGLALTNNSRTILDVKLRITINLDANTTLLMLENNEYRGLRATQCRGSETTYARPILPSAASGIRRLIV